MAALSFQKRPQEPDDDVPDGAMGFLEHLDELRTRIIRSCIALAIGMVVAFAFIDRIADFVLGPTLRMLPPGTSLIMTRFGEGLSFYMDLALLGGVLLAAPFVTYQVWRFVAPGLYARERRLILPFIVLAACGTLAGALFSHFVLFPSMVAFFGTFDSPRMRHAPSGRHLRSVQEHVDRDGGRFSDPNLGLLSREASGRDSSILVEASPICRSDQFRRRGGSDTISRSLEPSGLCRPDDCTLRA